MGILALGLALPVIVEAQGATMTSPDVTVTPNTTFVPLADYKQGNGPLQNLYGASGGNDLPTFINNLFKFALSFGAMAAVLRLVYAGFRYMGSDVFWTKGKAKEIIGNTIFGLILLLSIYLILYQINPCLLDLDILRHVNGNNPNQC